MNGRRHLKAAIGAFVLTALSNAHEARAEEHPKDASEPSIPLIVVSTEAAGPPFELVDAAARGLASPTARGEKILEYTTAAPLPEGFNPETQVDVFQAGEAAFYAGNLEDAYVKFAEVSAFFRKFPQATAFYPGLAKIHFRALLHLAVIAHGRKDAEIAGRALGAAAKMDEPPPSISDFPPWLCESFEIARKNVLNGPSGTVHLIAGKGCVLSVAGRALGPGPVFRNLPAGETYVRVRCGDRAGTVQQVIVPAGGVVAFRPLMLSASTLHTTETDLRLEMSGALDEKLLAQEISALGRAAGRDRTAAVVFQKGSASVMLVDAGLERTIRRREAASPVTPASVEAAAHALVSKQAVVASEPATINQPAGARRPWYKDWAAWTMTLCGAATLGTGIGLQTAYGTDSRKAPFSAALMASGSGLLAGGTILFFIQPSQPPTPDGDRHASFIGVAVGGTF